MQLWIINDDWKKPVTLILEKSITMPKKTTLIYKKNWMNSSQYSKKNIYFWNIYIVYCANKFEMAGYTARNISKVVQCPYASIKTVRTICHSNSFIRY